MLRLMVLAVLAFAVVSPVGLIILQSFLDRPFYQDASELSVASYTYVLTDPSFLDALVSSFLLATGMVVIAIPMGLALAFLMTRTNLPGRRWLQPLILLPLFISPLVLGFGYIVSIGPVGFITLWTKSLFGGAPWNLYSFPTLVIVAGLTHVPHAYIYLASALSRVNPDVEEAARVSGGGVLHTALTVSLPLIRPALVFASMLIFLLGLEQFGLPLMLGDPIGISTLTTYLYKLTNLLGTPSYNLMAVVATVIIATTLPLVFLQRWLLRDAERFVTLRGKGTAQRPISLGRYRWPALAVILLWLSTTVLVPLLGIMLRSIVTAWGEGAAFFANVTVDHFRQVLTAPNLIRGIRNTLLVAIVGGACSVAVYTCVAMARHRWRHAGAQAIDYLVMLPRALPGLIAGLAFLWLFLFIQPLSPLRGSMIGIWLAYTVVWLAYGMRIISSALGQVAPELEEAGRVTGASVWRVGRDVTLPLIRSGLIASWLLIFLTFVREYSTAVYLMTPNTEVIGSLLVSLWNNGQLDLVAALCIVNLIMVFSGLMIALRLGVRLHD
ncbi:iron ABC transporter permease [Phyllobacterium sp. SB3]|uniref:ABC transporter permease n=1 Tax=Phyllobacterium sp. SB3 TaxID=3156073 RepID=UPI0032AEA693